VIEEIRNYFPLNDLNNLSIFEPSNLSTNIYGADELKNISNMFGFDEQYYTDLAFYFQTLINLIKNKLNFTTL
jgi:hypothetical protein